MNFGANKSAVVQAADILDPVDDPEVSGRRIEEPGIARLDIAVGGQSLGGLGVVLKVTSEHAWRLELHLAAFRDADGNVRHRQTDGVGVDLPVRLGGEEEERLGLAIELFQVQPERAEE